MVMLMVMYGDGNSARYDNGGYNCDGDGVDYGDGDGVDDDRAGDYGNC